MQSTGVLNLSIGLTGVKENRGAHLSYISCPRALSLVFTRFYCLLAAAAVSHPRSPTRRRPEPPPPHLAPPCAAAQRRPAATATHSLRHHRSRSARVHPAPPACATTRTCCSPPPPLATPLCRHEISAAAPAPRAAHAAVLPPQSLSARRVLDELPEPLVALFSRHVRVPGLLHHNLATASRDGSREEEGEGGCCREARPQADSRRERGREDRDGGQGRRGAGIRPCSSVQYQGAAS